MLCLHLRAAGWASKVAPAGPPRMSPDAVHQDPRYELFGRVHMNPPQGSYMNPPFYAFYIKVWEMLIWSRVEYELRGGSYEPSLLVHY